MTKKKKKDTFHAKDPSICFLIFARKHGICSHAFPKVKSFVMPKTLFLLVFNEGLCLMWPMTIL